jgi:hypothetical protein
MSKEIRAMGDAVALGQKHIEDQRGRVSRQRELLSTLERDGDAKLVRPARQLLREMLDTLERMLAEQRALRLKKRSDGQLSDDRQAFLNNHICVRDR